MNRRGLTLLELVVVLAILAVLASVATVLTENTVEQARYDATVRTLDQIQAAVMGSTDPLAVDAEGFLADTGVLPTTLDELLVRDARLVPFGPHVTTAYPGIVLHSGWRGPYLKPAADGQIRDGWGNAFEPETSTTFFRGPTPLVAVKSRGGGGTYVPPTSGVNPYRRAFTDASPVALHVTLNDTADTTTTPASHVKVVVIVPDATQTAGVRAIDIPAVALAQTTSVALSVNRNDAVAATYVPASTVAVRAYPCNSAGVVDTARPASPIRYIRVPADRAATVTLSFDLQ